jgi:UDP-N-acetylmuramoyl-tripeptide--D-alanyl-D-alanine ligase
MLELGQAGEELHRRCGQHMVRRGMDVVIGVRGLARSLVDGARTSATARVKAEFLESPEQAGDWLRSQVRPGDVVLLKASRGVHLERALELWQKRGDEEARG